MDDQADFLLPSPSLSPPPRPINRARTRPPNPQVQQYIEETLKSVASQILSEGQPAITLKRRVKRSNCTFIVNPSNGSLESTEAEKNITYTWPGKDGYEAWRFDVALRILSAIHKAVNSGLVISKRDIYYSDPIRFQSQSIVDIFVDDFALTIGVDRSELNVEAAAKGLVTGYYQLITTTDEVIDARASTKDCLIPRVEDISRIDTADVDWAVFRRLSRSNFHLRAAAGKGILITGKGYPDLETRAFIRKLSNSILPSPSSPDKAPRFYALVDGDPDGMSIMSTYKYGSMAHTRENNRLNLPCLRWLGLRMSDVVEGSQLGSDESLITLSKRDRRKIVSMLAKSPVWAVDGPELEWRVELQRMLMLNVKAEIEIEYDRVGGLEGWIDREMAREE
ncbi:Spo11/DNA topoisomerase VI subunit A [Aspergillus cavernicola]|uniref:DNA topoisomerase (ATP-hydrolyzing) n=1 Tax=Aspergillus cavernicola TaxID=176166 RepID=A0ABR4IG86_9EURO